MSHNLHMPESNFIQQYISTDDVIFDQAYTASFHQKIESVEYNSVLAITGAIRGTLRETLSWARFGNSWKKFFHNIYSIWDHTTQEMLIIFLSSK